MYVLGTPIFDEATIHMQNGNSFTIRAQEVSSENRYIQKASLGRTALHQSYLSHSTITAGGNLDLKMGNKPNQSWATDHSQRPVSAMNLDVVVNPVFDYEERGFLDTMTVSISTPTPGAVIHYTIDGSKPSEASPIYKTPIILKKTTQVQALAVKHEYLPSYIENVTFTQIPYKVSVAYKQQYSLLYTAGGKLMVCLMVFAVHLMLGLMAGIS